MSYIGKDPESYEGKVVGSGQCVAFVRACSGAPVSTAWSQGAAVKTGDVPRSTAIATFDDHGNYPNEPTGQHAAIFISKDDKGIWVWDQWSGQPVHKRYIRYKGGSGSWSNDADRFSMIEPKPRVKDHEQGDTLCVNLGALPAGVYGGTVLQIAAPSFIADVEVFDQFGQPLPTRLDHAIANNLQMAGLGRFQKLKMQVRPWSSTVLAATMDVVSMASDTLMCMASDADGMVIFSGLVPSPPGTLSKISLEGEGLRTIEISAAPELVIVRLCVSTR